MTPESIAPFITSLIAMAFSLWIIWKSRRLAAEARATFVRNIHGSPYRDEVIAATMERLGPLERRNLKRALKADR